MNRRWVGMVGAAAVVASALAVGVVAPAVAAPCDPGGNPIVCENSKPGNPESEWEVQDEGDPGLQGFATKFSVNVGETEQFKVKTTATGYTIDIYRLGWYAGNGARKVASVTPTPRNQPSCMTDATTGLVDCGNWAVSASWAVPSTAVSGVYIAHLVNPANQDESQITFVVRNDSSHSDILFQTSDATWQAYNTYGGSSFYTGIPDGRAYKLSYNRPFSTRGLSGGRDFLFSNEFPMLQFMERNGYDVSYFGSLDTDRRGALIKNHKVFTSTGHDEYWSGAQRANVESARDAGVNLAFFSGNEVYWRTRWEPSIDGTSTDGRTLVCYKETWANAKIDPASEWTGTWRDPRFATQAQGGGLPENGLTGTIYKANNSDLPITVSAAEGKLRLWRNTTLTGMAVGQTTALADHTIGYESDEDLDNGSRPPGLIRLSTTTGPTPEYLVDYGSTTQPGSTTHHLTLYRATSGALVFGAGTIQWSWGLSQNHDGSGAAADVRIQQATVNILADMGALAGTIMPGLAASTRSTDSTGPTVTVSAPTEGAATANGTIVNVTGTATDVGGKVAGVEVSTDNGASWHPATGTASWTYSWVAAGRGSVPIKVRAIDDSANIGSAVTRNVSVSCPCSLFGEAVPAVPAAADTGDVELGIRFVPSDDGYVSGIRFYKGSGNTGSHTGSLWSAGGQLLATGTFTNESASGWQTLVLPESVSVSAGTTYVASYRAPNGHYAAEASYFTEKDQISPPLRALGKPSGQLNGVYSTGGRFPASSFADTNYYVDVLFSVDDTTAPVVTAKSPLPGSTSVAPAIKPKATFSRAINTNTLAFIVKDAANQTVSGAVTYDSATRTATFSPAQNLAYSAAYSVSVSASSSFGVPMTAPATWSFTTSATDPLPGACPCSIFSDSDTPATLTDPDTVGVELGAKFTAEADGEVVGVKFYKGPSNLGTHTGSLWTASGQLLASTTFVGESSNGWQMAQFSSPVSISADTTYVISYRAPVGGYSSTANGLSSAVNSPPLHTVAHGGVYSYSGGAPLTSSDANYWVDVLYNPTDAAPTVSSVSPGPGATNVSSTTQVKATLAGQVRTTGPVVGLKTSGGVTIAGVSSYNATSKTISFVPTNPLSAGQSYQATASGATSLSGQTMPPFSWTFTTAGPGACPCTLFDSTATPPVADANDAGAVTLGVKFTTTVAGYVTGLRFYKSAANTGTHVGSLWSSAGAKLATVTFTGESATGWQTAQFAQPVQLTVGDTYVVSYRAPSGHYAATQQFFASSWDNVVLTAPAGANGVYAYGTSEAFPASSYASSNYWVDPIFASGAAPDTTAPMGVASPIDGASSVSEAVTPSVTFSEGIDVATLQLSLKTAGGQAVAGSTAYDSGTRTATFTPGAVLARGATYTGTVAAADPAGNAMTPLTWAFTTAKPDATPGVCPCSIWNESAVPGMITVNDPANVELGVKFSADTAGTVTGVRFYKGPQNTGSHTGSLWDTAGNRLATATFTGESSTGWQSVSFATPVSLTAGTTYIASYSSSGYYSATVNGLATALDQPPLHTPSTAGLYVYGAGFPTNSSSANYWVDVVFAAGGTPPADTTAPVISAVQASAGATGSTATLTWTTDESATSVVQYGTTTALGSTATGATGTSHSVALSGLTSATTYYYRVTSVDSASNSATSPAVGGAPATFATPDVTAPTVSAVAAAVSGTTATVSWTTDESATTKVDYGTSTALGTSATGATGTSHSVPLTGLAAGTYYYRVTSADTAGNSTTDPVTASAPRSFVIADTVAPTISAVDATGSGTTATVTWATNESASTSVSYGTTTSLGTTKTGTAGTSHSVALTGLTPNTRYYYRVTSADASGNSATSPASPAAPASYLPTVAPIAQTTVADFSGGSGGYVSDTSGGEVLGTLTVGSEFGGTTTPTGFTTAALVSGGATTYSGGQASLSGSRLYTTTYASGRSFASAATLGVNQTIGWGSIASGSTAVTASFQTSSTGALSARVNDGFLNNRTISIGGSWTGAEHEYRVDWSSGSAVFFIDGTQVATSAFSTGLSLRVIASDPTTAAPVLAVDWTRVAPYAASTTFTSAVIDAGATVGWDTLSRDVVVPSGTTMTVQVRSGPNANSGSGAWTSWSTVSTTTNSITRSSRYLQYRLQFTSSGTRFTTATVNSVQLAYHVL